MKITFLSLLPALQRLGEYLQIGVELAEKAVSGRVPDADTLGHILAARMSTWDPVIMGRHVLDVPTREAAARFLAGVAVSVTKE